MISAPKPHFRSKSCSSCPEIFLPHSGSQKACDNCRDKIAATAAMVVRLKAEARIRKAAAAQMREVRNVVCAICSNEFPARGSRSKYCSPKCVRKALADRANSVYNGHIVPKKIPEHIIRSVPESLEPTRPTKTYYAYMAEGERNRRKAIERYGVKMPAHAREATS